MRFRLAPYLAYLNIAMAKEASYRFDVFTSLGSVVVRVYLLATVWRALYRHNAAPDGLPLHAILTYATVALLFGLVMDIDQSRVLYDRLHDGSIATDFLKPISVPLFVFAEGSGEVLFHAILIVPALVLSLFIVHIDVPSAPVLAMFALSALLGYLVGYCINFLINVTAFWTLEVSAARLIVTYAAELLGGQIIPLVVFPVALQKIVFVLPFAAMFSTPLLIYVGRIPPQQWASAVGVQALWVVLLAGICAVLWRAASRRVVVQGG